MELLEKLQVPGLLALVIVVMLFLKAMMEQRTESKETLKAQIDTFLEYMKAQRENWHKDFKELHEQHLEARELSRSALKEQLEVARETARGNMEMARAITHLSESVKNHHK